MNRLFPIVALFLSACVAVPPGRGPAVIVTPVAPLLQVTALRIDPYAPYGYEVTLPYTLRVDANVRVTRVCYRWPRGGVVCDAPYAHRHGRQARIRTSHRHRRPQELTGWIEYESGGRVYRSNEVRTMVAPR